MIEKMRQSSGYNAFVLICDECGSIAPVEWDRFYDALDFKKDKGNGWRCHRNNLGNTWQDLCPTCAKEATEAFLRKKYGTQA